MLRSRATCENRGGIKEHLNSRQILPTVTPSGSHGTASSNEGDTKGLRPHGKPLNGAMRLGLLPNSDALLNVCHQSEVGYGLPTNATTNAPHATSSFVHLKAGSLTLNYKTVQHHQQTHLFHQVHYHFATTDGGSALRRYGTYVLAMQL